MTFRWGRVKCPGPRPLIRTGYEAASELPADDAIECWTATLERLLRVWV
jgi:hypothetical protein